MAFGFPYCRCMHDPTLSSSNPRGRWRALLPFAVPVVLAHLALAGASLSHAETAPSRAASPTAAPVLVRVVEPALPAAALAADAVPAPVSRPPAVRPARAASAIPVAFPPPADAPVYRTRIPPPTTLRYALSRGPWNGNGELVWEHQGDRYHARLEGRVAGFKVLTWDSSGAFDAAGLAPTRFTDERRGKAAKAANFQRGAGKITYSGPPDEYPLLPGSQDRLSWMVQIAAIASADPQRVAPGKRVSMFVSGARGDADMWTFQSVGAEPVSIGGSSVPAIKLLRQPRKAHDTRVEVWLDPALHHLPVRARLTSSPENETLELVRRVHDPS
jgi:hypothetical protein